LKGGKSASSGSISIQRAKSKKVEIYSKVTGLKLSKDDLLFFRTGGGGGFGNPLQRSPERVAEDVKQGFVSLRCAKTQYGVELEGKVLKINESKTKSLRQRLRIASKGKKA
jgi:N-methylhydantoinase B